jgi:hypothetical protein
MARILVWTEADISRLEDAWGVARILTEIEEDGTVTRELGLDAHGNVIHRHPGEPTRAQYGFFDLARIELRTALPWHWTSSSGSG